MKKIITITCTSVYVSRERIILAHTLRVQRAKQYAREVAQELYYNYYPNQ